MDNNVSEMIASNIIAWAMAYYRVWTCCLICRANIEPIDAKIIRSALDTEANTMLRKVSKKFRDVLTPDDYTKTVNTIKALHDDTFNIIMKSLYSEEVI